MRTDFHNAIRTRKSFSVAVWAAGALLVAGCAYIKHVPPGQSLNVAMAAKAELVALPTPTPGPLTSGSGLAAAEATALPGGTVHTEQVADSFALGNLCLQQGRYQDAINAYQTAVKNDPTFADAWNNLAIAYQDLGQQDKAVEAFRHYKTASLH